MADTYSAFSQLLLMQDGSHANQWGDLTNTNLILIDQAMSQVTSIAVTNTNYPLTNYAASQSQSRSLAFNVTGTLTAAVAIELPTGYPRLYVFYNAVTNSGSGAGQYALTVQNGTGTATGAVVSLAGPGVANLVYTDGTNCYGAQPPGSFAQSNVYQTYTAGSASTPVGLSLTGGPAYGCSIDTSKSNEFYVAAPAGATSITFTLTNSSSVGQLPGQTIQVAVSQNSSGACTIGWPSAILWPNGVTPTWSTEPSATDMVTLTYTNIGGTLSWVGSVELDYGATGGAGTYNFHIAQNTQNLSILSLVGAVSGAVVVNLTVNTGVQITANTTANYALDCSGLPSGSTVNLYNYGYIAGCGGLGGPGAFANGGVSFGFVIGSLTAGTGNLFSSGLPGGAAINGPGSGRILNVYNHGHIWGGGGGGGGGGCSANGSVAESISGGGGGGGGAGNGIGGDGYNGGSFNNVINATNGGNGAVVPNSGGGAAGTGATHGTASAGNGGAGGTWGAAGANGSAAGTTYSPVTMGYGAGGAAGAAITASGTINIPVAGDILGTT